MSGYLCLKFLSNIGPEYTNCISAEWKDSLDEIPRYDTKQSDGKVSVGNAAYPFIAIAPLSSQTQSPIIFTNPSARAGYDTRSIFKRSLTGLNSDFSFSQTSCLTKAEEPSLPYYLPIAGGRIIGLVLCEMQSVSSRI